MLQQAEIGEVARSLAHQFAELDQCTDQAVLLLPESYAAARDLKRILREVRSIAIQVRAALPRRCVGVRTLNIVFGDRHVRAISLSAEK
jgi:hypothetical protein